MAQIMDLSDKQLLLLSAGLSRPRHYLDYNTIQSFLKKHDKDCVGSYCLLIIVYSKRYPTQLHILHCLYKPTNTCQLQSHWELLLEKECCNVLFSISISLISFCTFSPYSATFGELNLYSFVLLCIYDLKISIKEGHILFLILIILLENSTLPGY